MARKRGRNFPLEWKTDTITTTNNTITRGEFDLDLLPDEIAEILGIRSFIAGAFARAANDVGDAKMYLSMDPDADDDPLTLSNLEDLEVFYVNGIKLFADYAEATETGGYATRVEKIDSTWFPEKNPVLIGTNFAQVVRGDTETFEWITTVYFKRRRANAMELNQILLKRR